MDRPRSPAQPGDALPGESSLEDPPAEDLLAEGRLAEGRLAEGRLAEDLPAGDPLAEDHHVHSTFSDDAVGTLAENLVAAGERGLRTICLADHVRTSTTWVPELVAAVRRTARALLAPSGLRVMCGVEAKILDRTGRLDLPPTLPPVDRVLIADHQYPDAGGPVGPGEVRQRLARGELTPEQVVETLVLATAAALRRRPGPVPQLAHLFSLLPKVGLHEGTVGPDHLALLAGTARATGAVVEVNEKWACPGPVAVAAFRAAGVPVVASTDSHRAGEVGVYRRLRAGTGTRPGARHWSWPGGGGGTRGGIGGGTRGGTRAETGDRAAGGPP